jgi:hypothetical protein
VFWILRLQFHNSHFGVQRLLCYVLAQDWKTVRIVNCFLRDFMWMPWSQLASVPRQNWKYKVLSLLCLVLLYIGSQWFHNSDYRTLFSASPNLPHHIIFFHVEFLHLQWYHLIHCSNVLFVLVHFRVVLLTTELKPFEDSVNVYVLVSWEIHNDGPSKM